MVCVWRTQKRDLAQNKQALAAETKERKSAQQDLKELRTRISDLEADIGRSHATIESYQRQVQDTEVSDGCHDVIYLAVVQIPVRLDVA